MRSTVILVLAAVLLLSGCSQDDDSPDPSLPTTPDPSLPTTPGPHPDEVAPGPNPRMDDALADLASRCTGGDFVACDVLFVAAVGDPGLQETADTCGGRNEPAGWCAETHDVLPDLVDLHGECLGGDMLSCDALYAYAPIGSPEEQAGWTCGNRGRSSPSCLADHEDAAA